MEEQLTEDQQELKMREQKKAKDAKRIRGIVHEKTRAKEQVTCEMIWRNSCMTLSRNCSACGKDGIGMTTKADGLTRSCAPGRDLVEFAAYLMNWCDIGSDGKTAAEASRLK